MWKTLWFLPYCPTLIPTLFTSIHEASLWGKATINICWDSDCIDELANKWRQTAPFVSFKEWIKTRLITWHWKWKAHFQQSQLTVNTNWVLTAAIIKYLVNYVVLFKHLEWIRSCLKSSFLNMLNSLYSMLIGCNEINDGQRFVLAFLFCLFFHIWFWRLGSWIKCQRRRQFNCPWSSFQKPSNANQAP